MPKEMIWHSVGRWILIISLYKESWEDVCSWSLDSQKDCLKGIAVLICVKFQCGTVVLLNNLLLVRGDLYATR